MASTNGRLRGAVALSDHRSRKERSAGQARGLDKRDAKAIVTAEREVAPVR